MISSDKHMQISFVCHGIKSAYAITRVIANNVPNGTWAGCNIARYGARNPN